MSLYSAYQQELLQLMAKGKRYDISNPPNLNKLGELLKKLDEDEKNKSKDPAVLKAELEAKKKEDEKKEQLSKVLDRSNKNLSHFPIVNNVIPAKKPEVKKSPGIDPRHSVFIPPNINEINKPPIMSKIVPIQNMPKYNLKVIPQPNKPVNMLPIVKIPQAQHSNNIEKKREVKEI